MEEFIKRLRVERDAVIKQQRKTLDTAEAQERDLTPEEDNSFKAQQREVDAMSKRIAELQEIQRRNKSADAQGAEFEAALNNHGRVRMFDDEDLGSERNMNLNNVEMRKWVHGEGPAALRVTLPTAQNRDLTVGNTGKGGATVPSSFAGQLHEHLVASSAIR